MTSFRFIPPWAIRFRMVALLCGGFFLLASATTLAAECGPIDGALLYGTTEYTQNRFMDSESYCGWQTVTREIATYRLKDGSMLFLLCSESFAPLAVAPR